MKKLLVSLLVMAAAAFAGPVSYYGKLQAKNAALYSANTGDKVQLKGMSMFWDTWDVGYNFYKKNVIDALVRDWKIEIIRVAHGTGTNLNSNWKSLDETVIDAAISNDIYVIIDYHSHNAQNEVAEAKEFFTHMASKYGKYPNVIFEVFNEPTGEKMWNTIKNYANEIIPVIRKNGGADNLVIVGNSQYSAHPEEVSAGDINDNNYAVTFHFYATEHGVSDGAYSGYSNFKSRVNTALQNGMTVFVTEWGTTEASGDGTVSESKSNEWMTYLDSKKISWCNWSVSNKGETSSAFMNQGNYTNPSNWSVDGYSASGKYVYNQLQNNYKTAPWVNGSTPNTSSSTASSSAMAAGYTDYIDDFEDGDKYAFTGGVWYAYDDSKDDNGAGESTITNDPEKDEDGVDGFKVVVKGDDTKGMLALKGIKLVQGKNLYAPYVALGVKLNKDESDYDLSSCKSISYRYKGAEHNFKAQSSKVENFNYHKIAFKAQSSWTKAEISWEDLDQENWGKTEMETHFSISTALNTINKLTWEVKGIENANKTYDAPTYNYLYIDDVRCDGLAIKPVAGSGSTTGNSSSSAVLNNSSSSTVVTNSSSSIVVGNSSSSTVVTNSSSSTVVANSSSATAAGYKVSGNLEQTVAPNGTFATVTITGVTSFSRDWALSFLTIEEKNGTVTISGTVPEWASSKSETLTINGEKVVVKLTVAAAGASSSSAVQNGSSSSATAGSSATVATPAGVVDDFEDGDNQAYTGGYWFAYNDKGDKGASTFANEEDAENGGYVVIFPATNGSTTMAGLKDVVLDQGDNKYDPYVALGLNLGEEDEAYDLSSCTEISYDYIGSAHNFKAVLKGDGTGALTDYDRHMVAMKASTSWTTAKIAWSDLEQDGWGAEVVLDKSLVSAFHWEIKAEVEPNYLYVDNFKCDGLKIVPPASSDSKDPSSSASTVALNTVVANPLSVALHGRSLQIGGADLVNVDVFDMQGRPMMSLRNVNSDVALETLAGGSYIVRVRAGSANMTKRIMLK